MGYHWLENPFFSVVVFPGVRRLFSRKILNDWRAHVGSSSCIPVESMLPTKGMTKMRPKCRERRAFLWKMMRLLKGQDERFQDETKAFPSQEPFFGGSGIHIDCVGNRAHLGTEKPGSVLSFSFPLCRLRERSHNLFNFIKW